MQTLLETRTSLWYKLFGKNEFRDVGFMFDEIKSESLVEREERILQYWQENKVFNASVENRKDKAFFSFYDGPPFATGLPHYGHLLAGTIKDVVPRYKTMKGYFVPRRFGWDCHGLPVEYEIEKLFDLSGAPSIETFGIARFNEECRSIVLRYTEEWKKTVNRMGRWVDFEHTYKTMDLNFMESVWWVFKSLFDKGLVYEGFKVMPYSAKLGTPLSNFEASDNYKEVDDPALTVGFQVLDEDNLFILAWTTTPWTLISNLALMVGPDITYLQVRDKASSKQYILAKERLSHYFKDPDSFEIVKSLSGKDLEGVHYKPLFDYFSKENAFRVILEDSVSLDEGTGIVHSAPAFGEIDFYACDRSKIGLVCPVDGNGKFTQEIPEYVGQFVKDADKDIIARLKKMGVLFHQATIRHRYPFCWRSDSPLIYRAVSTWFVAVEEIKEKLVETNQGVHWTPSHIKNGRFGKWLEGARDWAISRNRYWGTPIPIWRSEDGSLKVFGSIEELEKIANVKITDLHRHHIDSITFTVDGKEYKRIPEVFDCWFESGSMPYAQNHYPFENKALFEKIFPADFIAEGADQTRGWFYTLSILSAALFGKSAFQNVIVNGIVLAEDGNKMSKRLKNYPEPEIVISKYGADAVRLYLLHSPAVHADDLRFSERGVEVILRQALIPLWNAYSFFITYARIYHWKPVAQENIPDALIDRWILSRLHKLILDVEKGMDEYNLSLAVEPFVGFIDQLTNWYIRSSRQRFWAEEDTKDRRDAFETLYTVLLEVVKIAAPFVPFIAEAIFQNIRTDAMHASVHLCDYPVYRENRRDLSLEKGMEHIQTVVSMGHALRKEHKIKVRQPLQTVYLASSHEDILSFLHEHAHLIEEELNVKQVVCSSNESQFVSFLAKPNFRVLGKKVGIHMKSVTLAISALSKEEILAFQEKKSLTFVVDSNEFVLGEEDIAIERVVKKGLVASHSAGITIALDTVLTDDLLLEGLVRELKNKINVMRRDSGLLVTDRITLVIQGTDRLKYAFNKFKESIMNDVLATDVQFKPCIGTAWDLNGEDATISVSKA
ncbi:MAG: isoleucine--tRNA ligase [Chlamydiales bacterium]|nr:isoleucine--tRNA ligase [Chlamydiales bacterium]